MHLSHISHIYHTADSIGEEEDPVIKVKHTGFVVLLVCISVKRIGRHNT